MIIVGLTGSIAMGKSLVAKHFRRLKIPVFDADAAVHRLYATNPFLVAKIATLYPSAVDNGQVNRKILSALAVKNPQILKELEHIVHPLVRQEEQKFLRRARKLGAKLVILEIPLLFETQGENRCDYVVVVSTSRFMQKKRALSRQNMDNAKLERILSRQWPDSEKRKRADFIIRTGLHKANVFRQVRQLVRYLLNHTDRAGA